MSQTLLPSSQSVQKCIEIITNPESAKAFVQALETQLKKAGVTEQFQSLIAVARTFADSIELQMPKFDSWSGKEPKVGSKFQNYQEGIAQQSAELFAGQEIRFDYALSDEAELLRGYSRGNEVLDEVTAKTLDKLFNAWLAEKGMITKNGTIYEADKNGQIIQEKGQNKKADAEKIRELIIDKQNGFSEYVREKNASTIIEPVAHEHPKSPKVQAGEAQGPA